jgi:hypothetical protein
MKFSCPNCGANRLSQIEKAAIVATSSNIDIEDGEIYLKDPEIDQDGDGEYKQKTRLLKYHTYYYTLTRRIKVKMMLIL